MYMYHRMSMYHRMHVYVYKSRGTQRRARTRARWSSGGGTRRARGVRGVRGRSAGRAGAPDVSASTDSATGMPVGTVAPCST